MAIDEWVRIEVAAESTLAEPIFQRRFGQAAPDFPYHVLASCRGADGAWRAAAYIHFTDLGEILLGGGACVDSHELRRLPAPARAAIRAAGGLYRLTLAWSVRHFGASHSAIFGYCGDALAERSDLAVGFRRTAHRHLLVLFTRELPAPEQARLIALGHAQGPF